MKKTEETTEIKMRRVAPCGDNLLVAVDPGTPIFDITPGLPAPRFIGLVVPGHQIDNDGTIYMTDDDFDLVIRSLAQPRTH